MSLLNAIIKSWSCGDKATLPQVAKKDKEKQEAVEKEEKEKHGVLLPTGPQI